MDKPPEGQDPGSSSSHENRAEGDITSGGIVQARDVEGGVNFYSALAREPTSQIPRQLPGGISHFVNRSSELATFMELLDSTSDPGSRHARILVISGSAGVGKTALGLRWAHRIRSRFPSGQLYINLRGYDDGPPEEPAMALDRMLRALGVPGSSIPDDVDDRSATLRSLIAERDVLIFLDNAVSTNQIRPLLPGSASPLVIVTSRSALPSLGAREGAHRVRLDTLDEDDALTLLRAVTHEKRADEESDLTELVHLCARLPLALRIAGERAASRPMMRLTELIEDLKDDSLLWEVLSLHDDSTTEAVRTVFTWSYRALSPDAARTFRLLGVNPGHDIGLSAAAALCGVPARTVRRSLDLLVGAFMVETSAPGRFKLHDLLKAYALSEARTAEPTADLRTSLRRLADWYARTLEEAAMSLSAIDSVATSFDEGGIPAPLSFATSTAAFDWFELERQNLISTAQAVLSSEDHESAWNIAMAASPIYMQHFTFDDWSVMSQVAVDAARTLGDPIRYSAALDNRGKYLFRKRRLDEARSAFDDALRLRETGGDERSVCESLNALGLVCLRTRELDEAAEIFRRSASGFRDLGEERWECLALSNVAEAYLENGDATTAIELVDGLPGIFARLDDPASQGNALWLTSWGQRLRGNLSAASMAIEAALAIADDANNRMWEAFWLIEAARVHLAEGVLDEATRCCTLAASLQRQIGDRNREALALNCAGEVHQALGNFHDASAFHQEAFRVQVVTGDHWNAALALANLADCEKIRGDAAKVRDLSAQGVGLLEHFSDKNSSRLRRRLITLVE